jgi:uncharacterized protein (DUF934 family)
MMERRLRLLAPADHDAPTSAHTATATPDARGVLALANKADVSQVLLDGVSRIDLHFPKFTDGRAYSQAFLLRRRRGFTGEIRATGDVLVDQLVQMQRTGFSSAVLRADQDLGHARRQFEHFERHYQGDAVTVLPAFRTTSAA